MTTPGLIVAALALLLVGYIKLRRGDPRQPRAETNWVDDLKAAGCGIDRCRGRAKHLTHMGYFLFRCRKCGVLQRISRDPDGKVRRRVVERPPQPQEGEG
jgi:hypothetical protein